MRMGVDLGGTKIEAAAVDDAGVIRARRRIATPHVYDAILGALVRLLRGLEAEAGAVRAVGIGTPGLLSARGLMQNAENTALQGQPFDVDLARVLDRPVRLANDAACFALSESLDGAGAGARAVFGVIVGTGCGGGLVVEGRIVGACEWGHNPLPRATAAELSVPCSCGRLGCLEAHLAGPALERDHGTSMSAAQIASHAAAGDPMAAATLDRYLDRLARALASAINLIDPDVIVLGGGLSNIDALYARAPALWAPHLAITPPRTRLLRNQHGDASGLRGAAHLWGQAPGS